QCEGQQCYVERDESTLDSNYYRVRVTLREDCVSGLNIPNGCTKYVWSDFTAVRCYCSSHEFCNIQDPSLHQSSITLNGTAIVCSKEGLETCRSYECLYVNKARQCQNSLDEFTSHSLWFGWLWQNTCFHHRMKSGLIDSECRCNTSYCNQDLAANVETMALNETLRSRPLVRCHFSFEVNGMSSDKYFCIGELCALSPERGVRTCVNITQLQNAEPIAKLGMIDFDNRTYYLCNKPFCNWNSSLALASLNPGWKTTTNYTRDMLPFEDDSAFSSFSLTFTIILTIFALQL
ncbi:hypothetical protein PFISCL1PPCAC_21934, partial [Pristionchus fissidentatus]